MSTSILKFSGVILLLAVALPIHVGKSDEVSGLVIPRDDDGIFVRNQQGQFEVTWTSKTKVALVANTRLLAGLKLGRFDYKIHSSRESVSFAVPLGPVMAIRASRSGTHLELALKEAKDEKWMSENGLRLFFNQKPTREQLGSPDDPRFIGIWDFQTKPRTISINGVKYEISMKKGGQTDVLLFNLTALQSQLFLLPWNAPQRIQPWSANKGRKGFCETKTQIGMMLK